MARADDHWCEGERGTDLSITAGTVSIDTHAEVSDLVIVNDGTRTSEALFLGIIASQNPDGRQGYHLLDVEDSHPDRDVLLALRWVSNRELIRLDAGASARINFRSRLREPPAGTYGLYARVYEWNSSRPDNGARCFQAAWDFEQQATFGEAEDDHGDSLSSATRVALPSETAGVIDPSTDTDWFRFEVPASGELTAETTGSLDTVGTLYDADGNTLASNDDSGVGLNFRIQRELAAGTYFLRVASFGSNTGSYVLQLRTDNPGTPIRDFPVGIPSNCSREVQICVRDHECEDGDEVRVTVNGEIVFEGELFNRQQCRDVAVREGDNPIEMLALNGTGFKGACSHQDVNTGEITVTSPGGNQTLQSWRHRGGAGSTANLVVTIGAAADSCAFDSSSPPDEGGTDQAGAGAVHLRNLGDFNGDGKDDVLLRHTDGRWRYYPMDGRRVLAGSGAASLTRDLAWQVAGIGDFNGDGKDDVLLRKTDGRWYFYPMDGRTVLDGRGTVRLTWDLAWQVAGIADFDGDGTDDVLLRHEDGRWHYYRMNGRRSLSGSGGASLTTDLAWQVAGVGDFDGDGRADVLMRHEEGRWYLYPMNGRAPIAGRGGVGLTQDLAWAVAGVGDFDADGRHDVLLRHTDGRWRYYPLQGRTVLDGAGLVNLTEDTSVGVAGIGDLNGDGCADVLARLANGGWQYYALDGRRVLSASGQAALSGNLAWGALAGGTQTTGQAPTLGATLSDRSLTLGQDETVDLSEAFVDNQTLTYEVRSSDPNVVRASVTGDVLTLMPVAEGTATVTVTARDPDGNAATQTFAVTVGESSGGSGGDTFRDCAECPLMVRIPAGTFTMGSPESEPRRISTEGPQRTVSIPAFAASAHEATFAEWDACVAAGGCGGYRPDDGGWGRGDRPVVSVGWDDAQLYVDWLSRTTGQHYRLLTESEWEYAARAGTTTPFHTGGTITPQQANFDGRYSYPAREYDGSGLYRRQTVPVGSFAPNAFGLYDMHGNLLEWVQDCWGRYSTAPSDGSAVEGDRCDRVLRGGSWDDDPWILRSANRVRNLTGYRNVRFGFRVARTL